MNFAGSNTGIGFDTATALATLSPPAYHIILTARDPAKGAAALQDLRARNLPGSTAVSLLHLEVTDARSIAAAVREVADAHGRLDVLINNAGIGGSAPGADLRTQLRETLETNACAAALVTEAFVPLLRKSGDARVVNVSSELGSLALKRDRGCEFSRQDQMPYRMSKAALNMMTACQAQELGKWGCKVWSFCPGFVVTDVAKMGEKGREMMRQMGAGDSKESAAGLVAIVKGKRDGEVGEFLHKDGVHPW